MREITGDPGDGSRTPSAQLRALGLAGRTVPGDDAPRWHLSAAEEEISAGRWDTARAALDRARVSAEAGTPEADDVAMVTLRLAVASVDVRMAAEAVDELRARKDLDDPVRRSRARRILEEAPDTFPRGLRVALLDHFLPAHEEEPTAGRFAEPSGDPLRYAGLPLLPGDDFSGEASDGDRPEERLPERFQAAGAAIRRDASVPGEPAFSLSVLEGRSDMDGAAEEVDAGTAATETGAETADHAAPDAVRDRLVAALDAYASDETADVLLSLGAAFLQHCEYGVAEAVASVAMQVPAVRLRACELYLQAMVAGGKVDAALQNARMAERLFAREGEALVGVVYWHGVAAQMRGDTVAAHACFNRVLESPQRNRFPDVMRRRDSLRA